MALSEADTRAKLIDPAIYAKGWSEDMICRETTLGAVEIIGGKARRRAGGRTDYTLRVRVSQESQPVAVALIEAKKDTLPPGHGLDQGKGYLAASRHNVLFVFSSNGYQFVEFDRTSGMTTTPRPMSEFPSPSDLRTRYERIMGFSLDAPAAKPLLARYPGGEGQRRYFQDAAIRAVLERVAHSETMGRPARALLSLATGTGKTFIACNLLKRIADAGQLKRALFLCDRDELRTQGLKAMQALFGNDAAEVYEEADGRNHAKNARVHVATYQTLGIDRPACEIQMAQVNLDATGLTAADIVARNPRNAITGQPLTAAEIAAAYEKTDYEATLLLPDRVNAMCLDLFTRLLVSDPERGPHQKTIIFCARDRHADDVAVAMNNLYAQWCASKGVTRRDPYAFKCTAAASGNDALPDFRGSASSHFIATTVELLTTGVDVPAVRNIGFFRYMKSPITFYQMIRARHAHRRADGEADVHRLRLHGRDSAVRNAVRVGAEGTGTARTWPRRPRTTAATSSAPPVIVDGFEVSLNDLGQFIVAPVGGVAMPVAIDDYKAGLSAKLIAECPTLEAFRARWVNPPDREEIYPIGLANLILHGIDHPNIWHGNALTKHEVYGGLFAGAPAQFDVVLTNPPFGGKESAAAQTHFAYRTSATQVLFLQHIIEALKTGGRCGMVIDEGVLFRTNEDAFVKTKRKLTDECDLWCVLSLPGGVFSAAGAGVKTNLLFFAKGKPTERIWYYDLSDVKVGKKSPLTLKHFEDFAAKLAIRADSDQSWTVDLAARRAKAAAEALPFRETARTKTREADRAKDELAALKKAKPRDEAAIAASEATIRDLLKQAREATNKADDIENAVYDLKAVNPNRKAEVDRRTPSELLDLVEAKGREIAEALKALRTLTS